MDQGEQKRGGGSKFVVTGHNIVTHKHILIPLRRLAMNESLTEYRLMALSSSPLTPHPSSNSTCDIHNLCIP